MKDQVVNILGFVGSRVSVSLHLNTSIVAWKQLSQNVTKLSIFQ